MTRWLLAIVTVAVAAAPPGRCEEDGAAWLDAYRWSAEASAGYRLVDIDGSKAKYREDYDLRSGGRLLGVSVSGRARDAAASRVDRFSLDVATPHDEPFSRVRGRLADDELYDLQIAFDRSTWDYAVPQLFLRPVAGVRRLDDLHDFDLERRRGSVDLTVRAAPWATLLAGYHVYTRSGDLVTTRFVPGADTFLLREDVDSVTHVGFVGTRLRLYDTDVDLRQEFRRTDRSWELSGPRPGTAGGLDPTNGGTLTTLVGDQDERVDAPTTRLRLRRTFGDRVEATGGYLYTHAALDVDGDRFRTGTMADAAFPATDRRITAGSASFDAHVADLDATLRATDRIRVSAAYRIDTRSQDGDLVRQDAFGRVAVDTDYRIVSNQLDGTVEADLREDLTARVGLRWSHRDADVSRHRVRTDGLGALADVRYRPRTWFGLDVRYESLQVDDPFTVRGTDVGGLAIPEREISLTFVNRGSAGVRVSPVDWASLRYRFAADSRENDTFGARILAFSQEVGVDLTPREDLSVFLSWSRRDFDDSGDIRVAPLYGAVTSLQRGSEDVFTAQLAWAFELFAERWSVGSNVAVVATDQEFRPAFEPGRSTMALDLSRVDGGAFVRLHHRWVEPAIEFRMIEYDERVLPANDYRATMALFSLTRRWSR